MTKAIERFTNQETEISHHQVKDHYENQRSSNVLNDDVDFQQYQQYHRTTVPPPDTIIGEDAFDASAPSSNISNSSLHNNEYVDAPTLYFGAETDDSFTLHSISSIRLSKRRNC